VEIYPSGIPVFVHDMGKRDISNGTRDALEKIVNELEQTRALARLAPALDRLECS
jgi:hypothetical protein